MSRVFKLRLIGTTKNNGKSYAAYALGVPIDIATKLEGRYFVFSIDDDGIHYRPVTTKTPEPILPSWTEAEGKG